MRLDRVGHIHQGYEDWSQPEDTLKSIDWMLADGCNTVIVHRVHGSELHYRLVDGERKCVYNSWQQRDQRARVGQAL